MDLRNTLLSLLVTSLSVAQAQSWTLLPSGTTLTYQDLWFNAQHPDTGVTCGYYVAAGDIIPFGRRTVDGGNTLAPLDLFFGGTFTGAFGLAFTDANTGYMCGGGMLKSYDGGQTWIQLMDVFTVGGRLYDVCFPTEMDGYTVGESWDVNGIYMVTHDAGATWEPHIVSTSGNNENTTLTSVARTVPDRIYAGSAVSASGSPTLFLSNDDGVSWSPLAFTVGVNDLAAAQGDTLFAATDLGIYRITSAGSIIQPVLSLFVPGVNSIDLDGAQSFAVAGNGNIYRSVDAGATWSPMTSPAPGIALWSVRIVNDHVAYACGNNGTLLRYDGLPLGKPLPPGEVVPELYPIPCDEQITLGLPSAIGLPVQVVDARGHVVFTFRPGSARTTLDVHDLAPGAYVLRSNGGEGVWQHSFLVVH